MKTYDVIVVGGGFAGCGAALAASRNGSSVLLIEQAGALGGAANICLVNPFMPNKTKIEKDGQQEVLQLSRGIFAEICEKLNEKGAMSGISFHEEYLKIILDDMMEEAGVDVLFHATLCECDVRDGALQSVTVITKSGKLTFTGKQFIDCTGDADLAVMSGCPYRLGREEDSLCQPMTLCFRVGNVDIETYKKNYDEMQRIYAEEKAAGRLRNPRENVMIFFTTEKGVLHFNSTRVLGLDPTDPYDLSKAEVEARKQMLELFLLFKKRVKGFENASLLSSGSSIGIRESRMIDGEHILTADEITACTLFDDAIALCNYEIDIHDPNGAGTSHRFFAPGEYYSIPYRSLIPKGSKNLLVAGRCISVDHESQASMRIMPTVCCIGQAAGTAAAIAVKHKSGVKDVSVDELRKTLLSAGAAI